MVNSCAAGFVSSCCDALGVAVRGVFAAARRRWRGQGLVNTFSVHHWRAAVVHLFLFPGFRAMAGERDYVRPWLARVDPQRAGERVYVHHWRFAAFHLVFLRVSGNGW